MANLSGNELIWLCIGLGGQLLFSMRFLLQWLRSEKEKRSVIPIEFWYFSLGGSVTLLAYAIHQQDPVFIIGQMFGLMVYSRNLYFIRLQKQQIDVAHR